MGSIDLFVIFANLLGAIVTISFASIVLYWVARAAVKAELKSFFASDGAKKKPASDSDVDNSGS